VTLDRALLAEKAAALERHLARVTERLPADPDELRPGSDTADVVVLNLWQAVQIVIDVALAACLALKLGTPSTYRESFGRLAEAGVLEADLAERLQRAAGFRNVVVHAYGSLDMTRIHAAARSGPPDLRACLARLRDQAARG